jgi:hypothetical protein
LPVREDVRERVDDEEEINTGELTDLPMTTDNVISTTLPSPVTGPAAVDTDTGITTTACDKLPVQMATEDATPEEKQRRLELIESSSKREGIKSFRAWSPTGTTSVRKALTPVDDGIAVGGLRTSVATASCANTSSYDDNYRTDNFGPQPATEGQAETDVNSIILNAIQDIQEDIDDQAAPCTFKNHVG